MTSVLTSGARRLWQGLRQWFVRNFFDTSAALSAMAALVCAAVAGLNMAATYWPQGVGPWVWCALVLGLCALGLWLAPKVLEKLVGHGFRWLLALVMLFLSVVYTVEEGAGEGWSWRVYLFAGAASAALWLLTASFWSLVRRRVETPTVILSLLLSAAGTVLLGVFLFTDGFDNHYIEQYLALSGHTQHRQESLESSLDMGPCAFSVVDYGPEESLEAGTVSLTRYMSRGDDDLTDHYVEAYWDYDLNAVPMVGRVWYPTEGENCPVLFMAHGNHEITTESYLGYGYLGEYLASHGYVVVSVDQNACNMLSGENDGRAVLLLEHIGLLLEYNGEEGNPLYRKLDPDNIAIAGHSRGGEMVATAYLFNGYDRYPENGTVTFDYNYSIKSIIALAPTVNQYKPADHSVELEDVNYLLLHGAADRDVTNFMGMTQYENISFTGEGDYLKSALYIAGANHGQFNTLWGEYDQQGPFTALFNTESLISQRDQEHIARVFIKTFLDVTLRGDDSNRGLLTNYDAYAAQLPRTVYVQCYETSGFTPIADFEEDSDLETATMEGAELKAQGVNWWTEELMNFAGGSSYDTHALRLRWNGGGGYVVELPGLDMTGSALVFDICDLDEDQVEEGRYRLIDGTVTLTDTQGNRARAHISDVTAVYPILPVRTDKLDYIFDTCTYKKAFATVSLPTELFALPDGEMDWRAVKEIRISFEGEGQVAMDNIGLEKQGRGA